jgi:inosine/xanthosine triphosphatase
VIGFNVPSSVPDQPFGDEETKLGAKNRAERAWIAYQEVNEGSKPDYSLGMEGGLVRSELDELGMECLAWIAVYNGEKFGFAKTASFELPRNMSRLINDGMELGAADDVIFKSTNSKQSVGTVGHLTNNVISRSLYYEQAVILAFIPFNWPELYP